MPILSLRSNSSAETIGRDAERRLRESPYYFLKGLGCTVEGGVLTLVGRVPYGPLKQFAEAIVARVDGVCEVINRVEVYDPERASA